MANRHRLFRRRGGTYYLHDALTRKQKSLGTKSRKEALRVLHAQREAEQVPNIARQIARAYLHTADPEAAIRTWRTVADRIVATKHGSTLVRWKTALKDRALRHLWDMLVAETWADSFLEALEMGTVSTNVYLRRLHNYAVDMQWVVQPIVPKRQWPTVRFREKRAITIDEHRLILEREQNLERKRYYDLAWHLGASQSDLAHLDAADVDRENRTITFVRLKLRHRSVNPPKIRFGSDVEDLLNQLPQTGPLFPYLTGVREADRATEFRQRCRGLGIEGVTLHSYRYSWAERAKSCGFPERFAQAALGHNSQAVHRAYSRKADVTIPSLQDYEREAMTKVIAFQAKSSDKAA